MTPLPVLPGETWRMEQFSRAYVQAVAAVAGCQVTKPEVDDDSIDLLFLRRTTVGPVRSPRFDAQLKATAMAPLTQSDFPLDLSMKNYDDLRPDDFSVPRILIVVVVPELLIDWANHSETELAMRRCGYWISLRGQPDVSNVATKTVRLARTNVFDAPALTAILDRIQQGGLP